MLLGTFFVLPFNKIAFSSDLFSKLKAVFSIGIVISAF